MGEWMDKRDNNGRPYKERVVGFIDVPPGATYHNRGFETASYWEDLAITPGRYDVTEHTWNGTPMVHAKIPSVVTGAYTPNSFAGVPFGNNPSGPDHPKSGNPTFWMPSTYAHEVHANLKELFGHPFTLTEMELEQNHQHAIESRVLAADMAIHSKGVKREYVRAGESLADMAYAGRMGDTVVMMASDRSAYVLVPESKANIIGPDGSSASIDPDWERVTIKRLEDGSLVLSGGVERNLSLPQSKIREDQELDITISSTRSEGRSSGR